MKVIVPPLKCQGIKTKIVPLIKELAEFPINRWIEPFLGSGVVAFNIAPQNAILNDINPHIIRFYKALQFKEITPFKVREYLEFEGENLRKADQDGYEHYRFIRDRFNENGNPLDFLFLSRTSFNGMMRFSKSGKWNIPFCKKPNRFDKSYITKIVNQVDFVSKIIQPEWELSNSDFRDIIRKAGQGDLIYCDPPYAGRYVDYFTGWTEEDERELFELLSKTKAHFILSSWHHNEFRENPYFLKYWSNFNFITRDHFYHSGAKETNRNPIVETLVFNFETNLKKHNHDLSERRVYKELTFSLFD
ncbi:MAG: Dam family site-specific DNA-(adenine-N6)-methyltransferase [Ignavibacteriales bacterium]|nr:MAG: Dam family site-specific DNA-(adenine-N6)-methyltransferase [Ignavibacteriaceae bacterium]MBW7872989.1 Dam family site-specific DNA-(adenine-N6)-methyltransferase [Ignavibacteria bacterium]MCZ2142382.1 Dam family site-specific DNA-(adenine-N6)-methyltransferase [Ignavibacteriales bacterium]MBV6445265.1 Modification methylase DpnIIA [Ignavibacteriaceae bacterium]MBZ0196058.1 Dam family site-specific DNA-(adenine-N6)-methyltransferase [Ignavibacteriaceae bacterium]